MGLRPENRDKTEQWEAEKAMTATYDNTPQIEGATVGQTTVDGHFDTAVREESGATDAEQIEAERRRLIEAMAVEFGEVQAANEAAIRRLGAQGAVPQVPSVNMIQFGVLLDMLFGGDMHTSAARLDYELRVQRVIAQQLAGADAQVARAKLTAPGGIPASARPNGSGLIIPGR